MVLEYRFFSKKQISLLEIDFHWSWVLSVAETKSKAWYLRKPPGSEVFIFSSHIENNRKKIPPPYGFCRGIPLKHRHKHTYLLHTPSFPVHPHRHPSSFKGKKFSKGIRELLDIWPSPKKISKETPQILSILQNISKFICRIFFFLFIGLN